MKRLISIIVFVIGVITVQAQQFEWATSFTGGSGNNKVEYSATDSEGNLYIAGQCGTGAAINGTVLLNMAPYGSGCNTSNFFIAKLSPSGQVIWRKAIHNNNGGITNCFSMQMLGDTAVAVLVDYSLATQENYLYYLDTLITSTIYGQPFATYPFQLINGGANGNGLIIFDLDGNIKEQHFLQLGYLDTEGREINCNSQISMDNDTTPIAADGIGYPLYIDNEGNIYIYRGTNDIQYVRCDTCPEQFEPYTFRNGKLGGIRFIIDGHQRTFDFYPNGIGEQYGENNRMILKFTPHFNDLLWAKYMIRDTVGRGGNPSEFMPYVTGMAGDNGGNIYVSGYIEQTPPSGDTTYYRDIILDSNNINNSLRVDVGTVTKDFLIKYNTEGNVDWVYSLREHSDSLLSLSFFTTQMRDVKVMDDSNMVFVSTYAGQGYASQTMSQLRGSFILDDSINIEHFKGGMFIKLDKTTGRYLSHGLVQSNSFSCPDELAIKNNQVFTQVQYSGILNMVDTNVEIGFNEYGLAMIRWDNRGHLIGGIDYNAVHPENRPGPTVIDNNGELYLCGFLAGNATFGDITVTSGAYIAKLTDSTFNVPYVYVPDTLLLNEEVKVGKMKVYPNPTESEVSIDMGNEKIKECYIMPILGEKKKISPYNKGNGRYTIDLSTYPNYTYIITVYTIKNHYQVKVVKVR